LFSANNATVIINVLASNHAPYARNGTARVYTGVARALRVTN
jgi:hypothetical protein